MLIPIGHEDQQVARLPWVTICLLVANVLVFWLTNQLVQQQAAEDRARGWTFYEAVTPLEPPPL